MPVVIDRSVTTCSSIDHISLLPIFARANDRNFVNFLHIEKIAVDTDQQRTFAGDGGTQHRNVVGISAQI